MATIDTRHTERKFLFMLLEAEKTGNLKVQIARQRAEMEKEDVDAVVREFEALMGSGKT
jgi:hypothetical protein